MNHSIRSFPRERATRRTRSSRTGHNWPTILGLAVLAGSAMLSPLPLEAAESWRTTAGTTTIHFNTDLLRQLGLELTEVEESAEGAGATRGVGRAEGAGTTRGVGMAEGAGTTRGAGTAEGAGTTRGARTAEGARTADLAATTEGPSWHFAVRSDVGLEFEVLGRAYRPGSELSGELIHTGGFSFRDRADGQTIPVRDFSLVPMSDRDRIDSLGFLLFSGHGDPVFRLLSGGVRLDPLEHVLHVARFDLTIHPDFARAIGNPALAGRTVGVLDTNARAEWRSGSDDSAPIGGVSVRGDCDFRDVQLGALNRIEYVNRTGSYPTGTIALSMATTSCNVGNCDIEWQAPMDVDHPGIVMALYRESVDGVLEQIGISGIKHAFFALSGSICTPCENPSDGTFLGVGCSDTYGVGTNADRLYLAPRDEWLVYPGTWDCVGSHFSGGNPDCIRVHGGSGHGPTEHRLEIDEDDLLDDTLAYYYEACYVVRDDQFKLNNIGWQPTSFTRSGNAYIFDGETDVTVHPGALLETWGNVQTWGGFADDGQVLIASKVIQGTPTNARFEYAVFNFDSDKEVSEVRIPVGQLIPSQIGFHDPNTDGADDWAAVVSNGEIVWTTTTNPISYGEMYNFRFSIPGGPEDGLAQIVSGDGSETIALAVQVPAGLTASVGEGNFDPSLRNSPNPFRGSTTIRFDLVAPAPVQLDLYDAGGRSVRSLLSARLDAGTHEIEWYGDDTGGRPVGPGVYYCRLQTGDTIRVSAITRLE